MILTNSFHPDVRVYKEAKYLVTKGFDVEILCWDRENEYINREVEEIEGIKIKRFFQYAKYGTGYKQIIPYIKFIKKCKKYLKNKEYQYLHCHDLDGVIAGFFCKSRNCKLIFDMHEFYEGQDRNQILKFIIRQLVNLMQDKSDTIIYVNEIQKTTMKQKNYDKLIYLPNYPESKSYIGCTKIQSEKLRVSYIGAVRQYNELKNLMDACKNIEGVEVFIHGAGTSYSKLKEIESNYNNVNITGLYHYSQSAYLYSQADILYVVYNMKINNWKISYPVKFFEAIITKTPIIVSKGSMLEEFLKDNDIGFVVDGNNVEEIRELIEYINSNRYILDEKMKNIEKIQFNFTWEEIVKNLYQIYK
ncbi:Glycosyltransferase involved in cell wall bisynthesis [Caminicella sporogenes DSM 14501]|uniref:Glycosyltransferase involved in cell wall bisynthesis n=2 Tax=Caminicella TaxID=166484 RepID=A0A1M6PWP6_9FIRM|nr:Glycosyltransferase involved in cell wall bisynthesis [Caminicella sporogenes DSM 14501]